MALIGFKADDSAVNRIQVLPPNDNLRPPAIQANVRHIFLFFMSKEMKLLPVTSEFAMC